MFGRNFTRLSAENKRACTMDGKHTQAGLAKVEVSFSCSRPVCTKIKQKHVGEPSPRDFLCQKSPPTVNLTQPCHNRIEIHFAAVCLESASCYDLQQCSSLEMFMNLQIVTVR